MKKKIPPTISKINIMPDTRHPFGEEDIANISTTTSINISNISIRQQTLLHNYPHPAIDELLP
jgi:hypothetical protein